MFLFLVLGIEPIGILLLSYISSLLNFFFNFETIWLHCLGSLLGAHPGPQNCNPSALVSQGAEITDVCPGAWLNLPF